jgi:hypothetical protein
MPNVATPGRGAPPAGGDVRSATSGRTGVGVDGDGGRGSGVVVGEAGQVAPRRGGLDIDALAVARGAAVATAVGIAAVVASQLLDAAAGDGSPLALPLVLATIAGLVTGGWLAARACARHPLTHAALAALVAVVVLLVVDVVRDVAGDDDVRWPYVAVWVLLALASGLVGGLAALHGPHRRADSHP